MKQRIKTSHFAIWTTLALVVALLATVPAAQAGPRGGPGGPGRGGPGAPPRGGPRGPGGPGYHHRGPSRDVANTVAIAGLTLGVLDTMVRWSNPRPVIVQPAPVVYSPPVVTYAPYPVPPPPPPPRYYRYGY